MKITKLKTNLIVFDNGTKIEFYHEQDCCEHVYADCEEIQALNHCNEPVRETPFDDIPKIEMAEGVGVILINSYGMKYLISCYNSQNGYYSSALSLKVKDKRGKVLFEISDVQKIDYVY